MEHYDVRFLPDGRTERIHAGATLFEAAGQADIILVSPCGGRGTCKKCRVRLEPSGQEVLACQYRIHESVTVTIPAASRLYHHQILEEGADKEIQISPMWRKVFISTRCDSLDQVCDILSKQYIPIVSRPAFDYCATDYGKGLTAVLHYNLPLKGWDIVAAEPGDTTGRLYGAAADIGTTTVVLRLAELKTGKILATASAANPQHQWGDDVISRIEFASTPAGQVVLQKAIIDCLGQLLRQAAAIANVDLRYVYECTAVGNTTMNHLLLKWPVSQLGQSPYLPHRVEACTVSAAEAGLTIHPAGVVFTPQTIAGFVGSDTLAAAVASDLDTEHQTTLLVDIGTNGELVLCHQDRLYTASCAAGPALEGARILHGSRAMAGAIQRVVVNSDDIDIDVIGGGRPHSICGSGLIDALAVLVELGIIDSTGRFVGREDVEGGRLSAKLRDRLIEHAGQPAFVFAAESGKPVVILTQGDIRQLQLAKAAIRAGIRMLEKTAGIAEDQIEKVLLAGAFGNYIQKSSAVTIGLLPAVPLERIHFVGNAASLGAMEILLDRGVRAGCETLARRMEYVELATRAEFQDIYADCLMFEKR
jgi:uncharacterized 2Fe-2S/4Fe-4S cluster protein (DUF4445 family)